MAGQRGLGALMRGDEKVALLQCHPRLLQRLKRAAQLLQQSVAEGSNTCSRRGVNDKWWITCLGLVVPM